MMLIIFRVGFLPEETYFFQDGGRNLASSLFFRFLPEEMEETYGMGPMIRLKKLWVMNNINGQLEQSI